MLKFDKTLVSVIHIRMTLEKILTEKLHALRADRKISWLASQTGISQASLARAAADQQELGLEAISKLVDFFGLTISEPGIDPVEYEMIPKVEARAGAGSSLITDDEVQGYYAFRQNFLCRVGIHAKRSIMLDVIGDSMQPLIMNGDTILVDQSQTTPQDGKIFLVGFGDELLVKRLQRTPRGWMLVSQNPDYAPMSVESSDLEVFRVYGRVRWFGRVV